MLAIFIDMLILRRFTPPPLPILSFSLIIMLFAMLLLAAITLPFRAIFMLFC